MKILIAVEHERLAQAQVEFITNHTWPKDVSFHILHAVEPLEGVSPDSEHLMEEICESNRKYGKQLVNDVALKLRKAFDKAIILESLESGFAEEVILDTAEKWQADLIVVGAHGRKEPAHSLLGSVSSDVLTYACCTVVVIKPARNKPTAVSETKKSASRPAKPVC